MKRLALLLAISTLLAAWLVRLVRTARADIAASLLCWPAGRTRVNTQVTDNSGGGGVQRALIFGGTLLLFGTWFILYLWVAAMTEGWLVPWDTVPGRPPVGVWQRTTATMVP